MKSKRLVALCLSLVMVLSLCGAAYASDGSARNDAFGFLADIFTRALCPHNWISSYVGQPYYAQHNGQIHRHQQVLNRCTICGDYYYSEACFGVT